MSTSISLILPNQFHSKRKHFDCEKSFYKFDIPMLNLEIRLGCGFWNCENFCRYEEYFQIPDDGLYINAIRRNYFDMARIFGQTEAWICNEDDGGANSDIQDFKEGTFQDWLRYKQAPDDRVYEYNPQDYIVPEGQKFHCNYCRYHESFKECWQLLEEYQKSYPEYNILTISKIGEYILASKASTLFLLNPDTGEAKVFTPREKCFIDINRDYYL